MSEIIFLLEPKGELTVECGTNEVKITMESISETNIGWVTEATITLEEPIVIENTNEKIFTTLQRFAIKNNGLVIGVGIVKHILE